MKAMSAYRGVLAIREARVLVCASAVSRLGVIIDAAAGGSE
jgi:hypothetical protein